MRGDGDGGGGVAPGRLQYDPGRRHPDRVQQLGDMETVILARDYEGRGEVHVASPGDRRLKHGRFGCDREKLLGIERSRHRPQARARPARKDNWVNGHCDALPAKWLILMLTGRSEEHTSE